jgi:hypothetical protein
MAQIHRKFTDEQVKELIERYTRKELERTYIQEILGIHIRRFFTLIRKYKENPSSFSIQYRRKSRTRAIPCSIEKTILKELKIDRQNIEDKNIPLRHYNYSYIKNRLEEHYGQK